MEILLFILYAILFGAIIRYWDFFDLPRIKHRSLVLVFGLKLIFGLGLAWIYTDHYENRRTGDTFRFFDDAQIMYSSLEEGVSTYTKLMTGIGLKSDPVAMQYYYRMTHLEREFYTGFLNDNATIIRFNAFIMLFTRGNYYVHIAFWCFLSMIGLVGIFKITDYFFPEKPQQMFLAVFLLPTVLFWGSGVLKEGILLFGLGLFVFGFFRLLLDSFRVSHLVLAITGFGILLITKGYVLQCMAPALAGLVLARLFPKRKFLLLFATPHILVLILLFVGPFISDGLKISELMSLKQTAFYNVAAESNSGSVIKLNAIKQPIDVLINAPRALINTYLRPWPWEWTKLLYIPAGLENLLLILCMSLMAWNFRKSIPMATPILAFCGSFVLVLGIVTGEVVPVIGAIVRYKLPALIFLFVLIFALTDDRKLNRRLPFLKRLKDIL